jgi:hypothetical protein
MAVTGTHLVRMTRHGLQSARKLWPKTRDRFEVRRQALKLRFWGERHEHEPGMLLDLSYESIKSLSGLGLYELRLDDKIGEHGNVRIIFLQPPEDWVPDDPRPMPILWVLEIFPKKRDDFTANEIRRFKASRLMIRQRFYDDA